MKYPIYTGETDLTIKTLERLKGHTIVSRQFISDLSNADDLRQVERDLIRSTLNQFPYAAIPVKSFAEKVKAELLPLKRNMVVHSGVQRYEGITLPYELRGTVSKYIENIYSSRIPTSAGSIHFNQLSHSEAGKNYFGHTRIEDMVDNQTRRVIEVQSDLYQKGRLEYELNRGYVGKDVSRLLEEEAKQYEEAEKRLYGRQVPENYAPLYYIKLQDLLKRKAMVPELENRAKELSKLKQYNNPTAHFRMIGEEIKKAAQDGKTILQFPTGETAMKIEHIGDHDVWSSDPTGGPYIIDEEWLVSRREGALIFREGEEWIVTELLGNGQFKALPADIIEGSAYNLSEEDLYKNYLKAPSFYKDRIETFDISGKIDIENPIYRFYETDIQKYLSKFGGKKIVDERGISWIELPVNREMAITPIMAFGVEDKRTIDKRIGNLQKIRNDVINSKHHEKEI